TAAWQPRPGNLPERRAVRHADPPGNTGGAAGPATVGAVFDPVRPERARATTAPRRGDTHQRIWRVCAVWGVPGRAAWRKPYNNSGRHEHHNRRQTARD